MVRSIAEYSQEIAKIVASWDIAKSTVNPWFRGQSSALWHLQPRIYRKSDSKMIYEREMIRDFKLYSHPYLTERPASDFEWLFLMQHYGVPTRLLDWTEASLVGLFFAVEDLNPKLDATVWILEPWSLNVSVLGIHSVPTYNANVMNDYLLPSTDKLLRKPKALFPASVRPLRNSKRIIAQRGTFTIHGKEKAPLDVLKEKRDFLLNRIDILGEAKASILRELYYSGITASVVFPELTGLAAELTYRYASEF